MPKRIETHRIDTRAVRTIFTHLNADWLVRNLEERDYGIDLQLERYARDDATGDFIFVQVKGTDSAFKDAVQLSFPVETINYALMFDVPFFVFHTSNASKATKFVWLQKYVETRLEQDNPKWQDQGHVTIYFPVENDLESNDAKITNIIRLDRLRKKGVKFIADAESLELHSDSVLGGQVGVAKACATITRKLYKLSDFVNEYGSQNAGIKDFNSLAAAFDHIEATRSVDAADRATIKATLIFITEVKKSFLLLDDIDDFAVEQKAYFPY